MVRSEPLSIKPAKGKKKPLAIMADFDGTACAYDVGNLLFARFSQSGWSKVVQSWERGELDSRECLIQESRLAHATREELSDFVAQFKPALGFTAFAHSCRDAGVPLLVVSDGFDFYIHRIFASHKLDWIEVRANHLIFTGEDTFAPEFPHYSFGCGLCGNCKFYHFMELNRTAQNVVFIGDGHSDRYCAPLAHTIYARRNKSLVKHLKAMGLPFVPYDDFYEIRDRIFGGERLVMAGS
jgi:2-hydroxy-3-keto-5-methylthiopentenyl-1-phosphate phosphatase